MVETLLHFQIFQWKLVIWKLVNTDANVNETQMFIGNRTIWVYDVQIGDDLLAHFTSSCQIVLIIYKVIDRDPKLRGFNVIEA